MKRLVVNRTLFAAALALSLSACGAHMRSYHVGGDVEKAKKRSIKGVFYTLPRTAVGISLPMKLSETKPGRFDAYAELFFPGARLTPGRSLTIQRAVFSTRGEPDPTQVYYMEVDGGGSMEQALTFAFTEQGAVTGLRASVANKTPDVILAGISAVSSLLTKSIVGAADTAEVAKAGRPDCSDWVPLKQGTVQTDSARLEEHLLVCFLGGRSGLRRNFLDLDAVSSDPRWGEEARLAKRNVLEAYADVQVEWADSGCTKTVQRWGRRRRNLAEALDSYLLYVKLAEGRNESLTGPEVALEGFASAFDQATQEMKRLRGQFVGVRRVDQEWIGNLEVFPEACDSTRTTPCPGAASIPLLKYAPSQGICEVDTVALRGFPQPPPQVMAPLDKITGTRKGCATPHQLKLILSLDPPKDQVVTRIARNYQRPAKAGLYYIVPAQMRAEIQMIRPESAEFGVAKRGTAAKPALARSQLMIAQRGIVTATPSDLGGKAWTNDVTFYDASGALKSYSLISTPMVDKGMVESVSGTANARLEALLKQQKEEAEAADPLTNLKKEKEVLEALLAIQKACAELENPPEGCGE